jgi:hypothetical protein
LIVSFAIVARYRNSRAHETRRSALHSRIACARRSGGRKRCDAAVARRVLLRARMETPLPPRPAWTIPFHVLIWTTLLVGLIMVMAVVLMH